MKAVERVETLAAGERHLTREESRYWCNQYLTIARELAAEVDRLRDSLRPVYKLPAAEPDPIIPTEDLILSKKELKKRRADAVSVRMKAYWAKRRELTK